MHALNQDYFDRPESLKIARGENANRSPEPQRGDVLGLDGNILSPATNGGIKNPGKAMIPPGTTLVRFANAPFVHHAAAGGWWLDFPNYKLVERYADAEGKPVATAMRELCAVPAEWSGMTLMIQARTRSPLLAYSGLGKPAFVHTKFSVTKSINPRAYSKTDVTQLYIPGLQSPDLLKKALIVRGYQMLDPGVSKKGYRPEMGLTR
ncbi:MAG: hypothetical protein AAF941_02635 [Pseudomonadota bacterium]